MWARGNGESMWARIGRSGKTLFPIGWIIPSAHDHISPSAHVCISLRGRSVLAREGGSVSATKGG